MHFTNRAASRRSPPGWHPQQGDELCFNADGDSIVTSALIRVERPERETAVNYVTWASEPTPA